MTTPAQSLSLCGVLSESKRIVNAHSRHFLALSVLFLLPLSFSLIIYPTLDSTLSHSDAVHTHSLLRNAPRWPTKTLLLPLLYTLFVLFLSHCAVCSITYSTYHGFYGRPVKLVSAIKSLLYSFLPLIATTIASQIVLILIVIAFALFVVLVTKGVEILGFEINYNSNYFIGFRVAVLIVIGLVAVWLQVNWTLASIVVVGESKWGFEPLRRSTYLVRGMRGVSLSLLLYFGILMGILLWGSSTSVVNSNGVSGWRSWALILQTVVSSSLVTLLMLHSAAANVVLYMYCKALHGELAFEIVEEFAREYMSLPFDDEKAPHVVSVVQA